MAPTLWNRVAMGFSGNRRKRFRPGLRENPQETSTPAVTGKRRGLRPPRPPVAAVRAGHAAPLGDRGGLLLS